MPTTTSPAAPHTRARTIEGGGNCVHMPAEPLPARRRRRSEAPPVYMTETTTAPIETTAIPAEKSPLVLPKEKFADPWAAATWLREQAISRRKINDEEADRIDKYCDCHSREYAIPKYCRLLGIHATAVRAHIVGS
jgi:hypothetical protein